MRIKVMNEVFNLSDISKIVEDYVIQSGQDPNSKTISVATVVSAYHERKKDEGILELFTNCIAQLELLSEKKRVHQLTETAQRCYTLLSKSDNDAIVMAANELQQKILQRNLELQIDKPKVEEWLDSQKTPLLEFPLIAEDPNKINMVRSSVKEFSDEFVRVQGYTTDDAKKFPSKTQHGKPYDHNRLGKNTQDPEFEGFYIAGSEVKFSKRTYDLMQAPLLAYEDLKKTNSREDTTLDFWNTVVVLRKSPIIVTTHDPEEKIPRRGRMERAKYWTPEQFPRTLKNGFELHSVEPETCFAVSRHNKEICLVKRVFIAHHVSGEKHQVTQLHYKGWPDHFGAPDLELLQTLNEEVEKEFTSRKLPQDAPVTVHCAAGMGRSPLFIAANYITFKIATKLNRMIPLDNIRVNPAKTVYKMRVARPSVLSGEDQWKCLYQYLSRFAMYNSGTSTEELNALETIEDTRRIVDGKKKELEKK